MNNIYTTIYIYLIKKVISLVKFNASVVRFLILLLVISFTSCNKDDDVSPILEEPKEKEENVLDLFSSSIFTNLADINIQTVANGNSWDTHVFHYIKDISGSNFAYCHPDVEYFENGFNGFKYWMAFTPYFGRIGSSGDAIYYENPSIVASNDGVNWLEPAKGINPIQLRPSYKDGLIRNNTDTLQGYWSDTDLLYRNNQLEVFYRGSSISIATLNRIRAESDNNTRKIQKTAVRTIVKQTSNNGSNWTPLEILYTSNEPETLNNNDVLSPSFVTVQNMISSYEVLFNTGAEGYQGDDRSFVLRRKSVNGLDFTDFKNSKIIRFLHKPWKEHSSDYSPWHVQASYVDGIYYLLLAVGRVKSYTSEVLYLAYSKDGEIFDVFPKPIVSSGVYRSCIFPLDISQNEVKFGAVIGMKTGKFNYRTFKMNKKIMNKVLG